MSTKYLDPTATRKIAIDPTAPGTIVRVALVIESILQIAFATYILLYPSVPLEFLAVEDSLINPLSKSLIFFFAALTYATTVPMLIAISNSRQGIETRVPAYQVLGAAEAILIGLMGYLLVFKDEKDLGVKDQALITGIKNLVPPLAWRLFVLHGKPNWIGRYVEGGKQA